MTLIRFQKPNFAAWEPFGHLSHLRNEIGRLFDSPLAHAVENRIFKEFSPAVDLYENKENYIVKVELPGLKKEDIDVSLQDGDLTISGERKVNETYTDEERVRAERFFGRFERSITLPGAVSADKIKASYKEGVLVVTLPKVEPAKPQQIPVTEK